MRTRIAELKRRGDEEGGSLAHSRHWSLHTTGSCWGGVRRRLLSDVILVVLNAVVLDAVVLDAVVRDVVVRDAVVLVHMKTKLGRDSTQRAPE